MVDLPIENGEFMVDLAIKHGGFIVDLAIKHGGSSHRFWYVYQRLGPWIHRPRHRPRPRPITTTGHHFATIAVLPVKVREQLPNACSCAAVKPGR